MFSCSVQLNDVIKRERAQKYNTEMSHLFFPAQENCLKFGVMTRYAVLSDLHFAPYHELKLKFWRTFQI